MLRKLKSIRYTINAIINDATATTTELFCNSFQVGQDTLFRRSSADSFMYETNFAISLFFFARVERLELPTNGFGDHYSAN